MKETIEVLILLWPIYSPILFVAFLGIIGLIIRGKIEKKQERKKMDYLAKKIAEEQQKASQTTEQK